MKKVLVLSLLFLGACALGSMISAVLPTSASAGPYCPGYSDNMCPNGGAGCTPGMPIDLSSCTAGGCSAPTPYRVFQRYNCSGTYCWVQVGCWDGIGPE